LAYEVRSVSDTGITVSDLDEAVGFWTEVLGFEFLGSGEVGGTLVENTTGVPGAHVRVAKQARDYPLTQALRSQGGLWRTGARRAADQAIERATSPK
jgi:catechol 2,3-dioxygenase-like lactoylglutathione lyase family enzyme